MDMDCQQAAAMGSILRYIGQEGAGDCRHLYQCDTCGAFIRAIAKSISRLTPHFAIDYVSRQSTILVKIVIRDLRAEFYVEVGFACNARYLDMLCKQRKLGKYVLREVGQAIRRVQC